MRSALLWYTNAITDKYGDQLHSNFVVEQMGYYLGQLQEHQQRRENNPVWGVPVKLLTFPNENRIEVDIEDDTNLLYLDFDA